MTQLLLKVKFLKLVSRVFFSMAFLLLSTWMRMVCFLLKIKYYLNDKVATAYNSHTSGRYLWSFGGVCSFSWWLKSPFHHVFGIITISFFEVELHMLGLWDGLFLVVSLSLFPWSLVSLFPLKFSLAIQKLKVFLIAIYISILVIIFLISNSYSWPSCKFLFIFNFIL